MTIIYFRLTDSCNDVVGRVGGVTQLDNVLYVACYNKIRTLAADTLRPLVNIDVKGMKDPRDIVVCRDDRQLYVADLSRSLWRVSVDDHSYVKWLSTESTTDTFDALSVTSRRLLVTSQRLLSRRLRQYSTTDRQLLRVVELPQYVREVYHGVETTRGRPPYVCRRSPRHVTGRAAVRGE